MFTHSVSVSCPARGSTNAWMLLRIGGFLLAGLLFSVFTPWQQGMDFKVPSGHTGNCLACRISHGQAVISRRFWQAGAAGRERAGRVDRYRRAPAIPVRPLDPSRDLVPRRTGTAAARRSGTGEAADRPRCGRVGFDDLLHDEVIAGLRVSRGVPVAVEDCARWLGQPAESSAGRRCLPPVLVVPGHGRKAAPPGVIGSNIDLLRPRLPGPACAGPPGPGWCPHGEHPPSGARPGGLSSLVCDV